MKYKLGDIIIRKDNPTARRIIIGFKNNEYKTVRISNSLNDSFEEKYIDETYDLDRRSIFEYEMSELINEPKNGAKE